MPRSRASAKVKTVNPTVKADVQNTTNSKAKADWKLSQDVKIRVSLQDLKSVLFGSTNNIINDDVETHVTMVLRKSELKPEPDPEFHSISTSTQELFEQIQQLLGDCAAAVAGVNCNICSETAIKLIQHIRSSHIDQINQHNSKRKTNTESEPISVQNDQYQNQTIFMCDICGDLLDDQESLNAHVDSHSTNDIFIFTEQDVNEEMSSASASASDEFTPGGMNTEIQESESLEVIDETHDSLPIPISPEEVEVATSPLPPEMSGSNDQQPMFQGPAIAIQSITPQEEVTGQGQDSLIVIRHSSSSSSQRPSSSYSPSLITCEICGRGGLISQAVLEHHIRIVHPPGSVVTCRLCSSVFSSRVRLEKHFRTTHKNSVEIAEKVYKCDQCPKSFFTHAILKGHLISHATGKPIRGQRSKPDVQAQVKPRVYHHKCDICGKPCLTAAQRNVHRMTHTRPMCSCDICGQRFRTPETLAAHKSWQHSSRIPGKPPRSKVKVKPNVPPPLAQTCTICNEKFVKINRHWSEVHPGQCRFTCEICGKAYNVKAHLRDHMNSIHGEKRKCKHCPKGFPTYGELNTHFQTHVEQGIPAMTPWVTKNANYYNKAKTKANLPRTCTFPCNICTKTFGVYRCLADHMKEKHNEIHGQDFACKVCEKQFFSAIHLNRHVREAHPGIRPYQCKICKQRFEHPSHLNFHSRKHKNQGQGTR